MPKRERRAAQIDRDDRKTIVRGMCVEFVRVNFPHLYTEFYDRAWEIIEKKKQEKPTSEKN